MSSGHVLIICRRPCIINDDNITFNDHLIRVYIASHHVTCHMAFQLLQNMASGHIKVKKKGLAMYFTVMLLSVSGCVKHGRTVIFSCVFKTILTKEHIP